MAAALVVAVALPAQASAGPRDRNSTLTLVGDPVFGAEVTFDYTTTAAAPFVSVECRQAGTIVYQESHGRWWLLGNDPFIFTLGPTSLWQGGDADCTATLREYDAKKRYPYRVLATTEFVTAAAPSISAPATVAIGEPFTVTGSGFQPGSAQVRVDTPQVIGLVGVSVDENGTFVLDWTHWDAESVSFSVVYDGLAVGPAVVVVG
jgi:hypothetical protein